MLRVVRWRLLTASAEIGNKAIRFLVSHNAKFAIILIAILILITILVLIVPAVSRMPVGFLFCCTSFFLKE